MLLSAPLEVFWCLTNRCNLSCVFCSADAGPDFSGRELGVAEREFILQQLIQSRVLKVYLTGGEPVLCPQVTNYIWKLRQHKIFVELTTNGTLLEDKFARELVNSGVNRVQVSLNGAKAEVNDRLMGESFGRIIRGLKRFVEYKLNTHVKVTVSKQNLVDIINIVNLLLEIGIEQIELSEIMPLGRGFKNYNQLAPAEADLAILQDKLADLNGANGRNVRFRSFSLTVKGNGRASTCTAGHYRSRSCLIMADGEVIPCTPAQVWGIKNNITQKGLKACWQDLENYSRLIDPTILKGKCGICDLKADCRGGCRALAYQFTGDLQGEYPLCPYNRRIEHERSRETEVAYAAN
jgi:radical SAM protein with 4Fe4S-binding SPASM domain